MQLNTNTNVFDPKPGANNKQTKIFEYSFVKESKYSKAAIHFSTKICPDIEFFI